MNNMSLLDEMQHKISYEDFEKSWKCFGLPKKVEIKRKEFLIKLDRFERVFSE